MSNKIYELDNSFDLPSLLSSVELLPYIKFFTKNISNVLVLADKANEIVNSFLSLDYKIYKITLISTD